MIIAFTSSSDFSFDVSFFLPFFEINVVFENMERGESYINVIEITSLLKRFPPTYAIVQITAS